MHPVVILHSRPPLPPPPPLPAICLSSGDIGHRLVLMLCNCWRATSPGGHVRPPRSFGSQHDLLKSLPAPANWKRKTTNVRHTTGFRVFRWVWSFVPVLVEFFLLERGKHHSENQGWKTGRWGEVKTSRSRQMWAFYSIILLRWVLPQYQASARTCQAFAVLEDVSHFSLLPFPTLLLASSHSSPPSPAVKGHAGENETK